MMSPISGLQMTGIEMEKHDEKYSPNDRLPLLLILSEAIRPNLEDKAIGCDGHSPYGWVHGTEETL